MFAEVQGDLVVPSFELSAFQKRPGTAFCNRDHVHVMRTGHLQSSPPSTTSEKSFKVKHEGSNHVLAGLVVPYFFPLRFFFDLLLIT